MRAAVLLASLAACSSPADPLTCDEALATLASCSSADQAECADDSPAAQRVADGECSAEGGGGKSDWFGNRVWGEACTWNWQCQGDTRHSCNAGTCYLRSNEGNACDRRDDRDCAENLRCADDLAVPSAPAGVCQATRAPVRPALYAETLRPNEAREFQEHAADIMTIQMKNAVQRLNGDDTIRRTFHAKRHACVVGDFEVVAAPAELATGPVFAQPRTFPAWVRFSNGTLTMGADSGSAIQGLAVKLMGVGGPKLLEESAITQDFLMINLKANVVANANEFMELTKAQDRGGAATAHYLLTHPRVALRVAPTVTKKVKSARVESYWAANAYKHGAIAVKYSMQPCAGTPAAIAGTGDSYLRADLKAQLATGTVCFDVFAQKQLDSVAQSIEDGTSEWDSPAIKIARLTIPRTALDTPAVNAVEATCNELSFNPWNTAPEYRPLGHMNRSRKAAYEASKNMRNAAPEPTTIPGRTI